MEKIGKVLTKRELFRLRDVLNKEYSQPKNNKYSATLLMYIQDLEKVAFHEHYLSILYFLKYYRTTIDLTIKSKLRLTYNNRTLDFEKYKEKVRQKFYKYTKKDYPLFLKRSQYFFSLYKNPMDFKNFRKNDYLNRIYLGLGFEFLLKSIFLKRGYVINKIKTNGFNQPVKIGQVKKKDIKPETYELGHFIDLLPKIKPPKLDIRDFNYYVVYGVVIAQNWRNQDMHTPTGVFSLDNVQADCIKTAYYYLYKIFLKKESIPKFPS